MLNTRILTIAMGQMLVIPGHLDDNLARAHSMIQQAGARNADVVVLPETLDLGWTYSNAPSLAQPIPGPITDLLASWAQEASITVVAGLTEKAGEQTYNTAVILSPAGELVAMHRKVNELPFALATYSTGTSVGATDLPRLGRIGLAVCADLRLDGNPLGESLGAMGATILLSPSSWAVPPDHDNTATPYGQEWIGPYAELARKYQMPVVGVSNVGPVVGGEWDGWKCIGCSIAVDSDGAVVAQGPYGQDAEARIVAKVRVRGQ